MRLSRAQRKSTLRRAACRERCSPQPVLQEAESEPKQRLLLGRSLCREQPCKSPGTCLVPRQEPRCMSSPQLLAQGCRPPASGSDLLLAARGMPLLGCRMVASGGVRSATRLSAAEGNASAATGHFTFIVPGQLSSAAWGVLLWRVAYGCATIAKRAKPEVAGWLLTSQCPAAGSRPSLTNVGNDRV